MEADLLVLHPISLGVDAGTLELCPPVELNDCDLRRILGIIRYAEKQGVLLALENGTTEILKWVRDQLKEKADMKNFGKKDDHALPGKGTIDWQGVHSTLVKINFEGPFVFELRTPLPLESAGKAKEFMVELFDSEAR